MFLTNCNQRHLSGELLYCSRYAFDINVSLSDCIICNQKFKQPVIVESSKGKRPSSLKAAKLHALECTPSKYLQNFACILSDSEILLNHISNISSSALPL